jgi:hypothetical protein
VVCGGQGIDRNVEAYERMSINMRMRERVEIRQEKKKAKENEGTRGRDTTQWLILFGLFDVVFVRRDRWGW